MSYGRNLAIKILFADISGLNRLLAMLGSQLALSSTKKPEGLVPDPKM